MKYLVFETEEFKQDLEHYGLKAQYNDIKQKIEQGEKPTNTLRSVGLEKVNIGNLRLIVWDVTKKILGRDEKRLGIKVFLRILKHEIYDDLHNSLDEKKRTELKDKLQNYLTDELTDKIERSYNDYLKPVVIQKPALPQDLYSWLGPLKWNDKFGELNLGFCESLIWSRDIKNMTGYLAIFNSILETIANRVFDGKAETAKVPGANNIYIGSKDRCAVFYSIIKAGANGSLIFLIKPHLFTSNNEQYNDIAAQISSHYKGIFERGDIPIDEILKYSNRAYPVQVITEYELWEQIEKDEESHPALSTEEENILLSISTPEGNTLPIFINGRAGSGKSTLLQYIFCLYANKKLEGVDGDILYLTYSEQLRKSAAELCLKILNSHYNFVGDRSGERLPVQKIEELVNKSFRTFKDVLLDILPPAEREQFAESKRIAFHQFKNDFYRSLRTPVKYSPETAWHVIRAYIKGREIESELVPDEYQKKPRKDKTVDIETYRAIYEKVWPQYKSYLKDQQYWDDLDLVNRVLLEMNSNPEFAENKKYVAVFCDEAQDFTKTELAFLLRMSVFSDYDLSKNMNINSLPFAFAGDPLQTLTPTGFNWEWFTTMFYEVLKENLLIKDPTLFINDKLMELEYNYRSNEGIVKFSNLIQFLRHSILGETCKPQKCWRDDMISEDFNKSHISSVPKYFIFSSNLTENEFEQNAKDSVIILPSEEGGLDDFISKDPILSRMKDSRAGEILFEDAISSKGLEMDKVIVYKFGHYLKDAKILWEKEELSEDQMMYFKYYMNRLYVAVTRARKQLNIVDTKEGYEEFWNNITEENLNHYKSFNEWNNQDCFVYLLEGSEAADLMEDKPLNIAKMYKEAGIKERNPKHMAKAMSIYNMHYKPDELMECEAYENWFSGDFKTAGLQFEKINLIDQAKDCFWEGQVWAELERLYEAKYSLKTIDRKKLKLAKFWNSQNGSKDEILENGSEIINEEVTSSEDRRLEERYLEARKTFIGWLQENAVLFDKNQCLNILKFLEKNNELAPFDLLISLYYKVGNYEKLVEIAEENDYRDTMYWEAKLLIEESDNEKIRCLIHLKRVDEAISIFEAMEEDAASKETLKSMLAIYEQLGQIDKMASIYQRLGEPLKVFLLIKDNLDKFELEKTEEIFENLYPEIIRTNNLEKVIREIMSLKNKNVMSALLPLFKKLLTEFISQHNLEKVLREVLLIKDKELLTVILPSVFEILASESTDFNYLDIPIKLVNEFYEYTNPIVKTFLINEQIVGASISYERLNCRRKDMLSYYEALMRRNDIEFKFINFVRERWLFVKEKHISSERTMNKQEGKEELDNKQKEWGIESIPKAIPSYEQIMKRLGSKSIKKERKEKEKTQWIQLELDDDSNFSYEDYISGEIIQKKNEYRITFVLASEPKKFLFRIDDKPFRLNLGGRKEND